MIEPVPRLIEVEMVYALADACWSCRVQVPDGSEAGAALDAAGFDWLPAQHRDAIAAPAGWAIFGRTVTPQSRLHDGDRVELLRPLKIDAKLARRKRAADARKKPRGRV